MPLHIINQEVEKTIDWKIKGLALVFALDKTLLEYITLAVPEIKQPNSPFDYGCFFCGKHNECSQAWSSVNLYEHCYYFSAGINKI